ncbi:hypothetical protein ACVJ5M_005693 [Bradyrhizobium sp. S3.7.6]
MDALGFIKGVEKMMTRLTTTAPAGGIDADPAR